ncbi:MAG: alpha/beta fold hydrolase [Pseudonocardiaceae bacterium]|nr:alpha/beta fold hydrolase [Pseudonocardiaceae bacterium]
MTLPVGVHTGDIELSGDLTVPADAQAVVVFAHGSGSSRHSSRNRAVARTLQDSRCATLLFDLLSSAEEKADEQTGHLRFDIELLTGRLVDALELVASRDDVRDLPIGVFGASTGAATALCAAARRPELVRAVVSRGGRPDLAGDELESVLPPTLLLVGDRDEQVMELNRQVEPRLGGTRQLTPIPGASHLFQEQGALEQVAEHAAQWFRTHLISG